jgi:ATP-dependent Clp protease ATP-binding subunit ClpC
MEDELAEMIIKSDLKEGDTITVDFDSENQKMVMQAAPVEMVIAG